MIFKSLKRLLSGYDKTQEVQKHANLLNAVETRDHDIRITRRYGAVISEMMSENTKKYEKIQRDVMVHRDVLLLQSQVEETRSLFMSLRKMIESPAEFADKELILEVAARLEQVGETDIARMCREDFPTLAKIIERGCGKMKQLAKDNGLTSFQ